MSETRGEYLVEDAITAELLANYTPAQLRLLAELTRDIRQGTGYGRIVLQICGDELYFETGQRVKAGKMAKCEG